MDRVAEYLEGQKLLLSKIEKEYQEKDFKVAIFIINLKHRTDKLNLIKKEFKKLKISEYTIIEGIYGEALSDEELENYSDRQIFIDILNGKELTKPEIGCSASHNEIYKKIIEENYSHAIVFEDDVIIRKSFINFLNQINSETFNFYFDFLLLGYFGMKPKDLKVSSIDKKIAESEIMEFKDEIRHKDRVWGTHAYVISNSGAQKMLAINDKIKFRADGPWNIFVENIKLYATKLKFASQRKVSDLDNDIKNRSWNIWWEH